MKSFYLRLAFCLIAASCFAQTGQKPQDSWLLANTTGATYYLVERSNWSKYVNGKYIGLSHRETRANVTCKGPVAKGVQFTGFFYVLEETLKDMTKSAQGLDEIVASDFILTPSGQMIFTRDEGLPQLRNFPVYPDSPVKPGDRWQAEGYRSVDPKNDSKPSILPILVEYTFVGPEVYQGQAVYRIRAQYATRLNKYLKAQSGDPSLESASGTHNAEILVTRDTGSVMLILDRMDETFFYVDKTSVRFKGNTAIFSDFPALQDRNALLEGIGDIASVAEKTAPPERTEPEAFSVEETPQGIRLSVRDLRFEPDSDAILAGEQWRLDAIAKTLLLVKDGHFLVEGHTAAVGKAEGEKELSIRRAKKIVDELVLRGLLPEQFIYTGYGGTKPLSGNDTPEGRALNRRVEITILE